MKILWITNCLFPEAISLLSGKPAFSKASGGWLLAAAEELITKYSLSLVVVSVTPQVKKMTRLTGEKIIYYALPCKRERKYHKIFEQMWRDIVEYEKPDVVHIHGMEFLHGLAYLRAGIGLPTILSIQGIPSAIGEAFTQGMSIKDIYSNLSLIDLLFAGSLYKQGKTYTKLGETVEPEYLKRVDLILGRTSFDQARVAAVTSLKKYRTVQESLRSVFYSSEKWSYERCRPYSIFLSQGHYPIKGLHQVIKAIAILKQKYPTILLRIAGPNIMRVPWYKKSSYARFIDKLISKFKLEDNILFIGELDAAEMKHEYLSVNLYLCASSIENSPNSLGEAQILGVPCIAAFSGGIPDFIPNSASGKMYNFIDYIKLAYIIDQEFQSSDSFDNTEQISLATKRHQREGNAEVIMAIYEELRRNAIDVKRQ